MNRKLVRFSLATAVVGFALAATASAQDFQKTYRIGAGSQIRIGNVSGDVIVTGYDGDSVVVRGIKKGRDRDQVEIEDRSGTANVDVGVRYPRHCNCDASVRFEVQVPRSVNYDFDQVSSVSGDVKVDSSHADVDLTATQAPTGTVAISNEHGHISVELPAKSSFQMNARTDHGDIQSDFGELKIENADRESKATGSVGSGGAQLRLTNSHGDISIRKTG